MSKETIVTSRSGFRDRSGVPNLGLHGYRKGLVKTNGRGGPKDVFGAPKDGGTQI